ncbi:uncharacterized protein LOC136077845 [Hydra vulgaris]|uniref:Uncharacterized protein LOC136077845 n=1 Tax=Hydra vulgaris TaxID=6087 RepID=A0ABM4BGF3_HYDVU
MLFIRSLRTARRKSFENARASLIEDANIEAVENKIIDDYECDASCNNDISFESSDVISSDESSDKDNDISMTSKIYDINQKLLNFYLRYNLTRNAMEALLKLLNINYDETLPLSVTTLKAKSITYNQSKNWVKRIEKKNLMSYIGVKDNLLYCMDHRNLQLSLKNKDGNSGIVKLRLFFNLDGLPVFKSSKLSFWPILMSFRDYNHIGALPVALHCGVEKPNLNFYLKQLVDELQILSVPFDLKGQQMVISDVDFICDTPARSFAQNIFNHNAYYGCGYCNIKGEYCYNRIIFTDQNCTPRSDESYKSISENNQHGPSPLLNIPQLSGLQSSCPPEYMHLVLQGVVKKLCTYYFTKVPFLHLSCRLSQHLLSKLSAEIDDIRKYLPSEFHRKLSSLVNFKNWKASEFRQFVLYLGPFLLHDKLPDRYYDHFIMLHFSMYVLASDEYVAYHVIASECVKKFVEFMPILFSKRSMVYNMVYKYGPLDSFSAFQFENMLGLLKRRIKDETFFNTQLFA